MKKEIIDEYFNLKWVVEKLDINDYTVTAYIKDSSANWIIPGFGDNWADANTGKKKHYTANELEYEFQGYDVSTVI